VSNHITICARTDVDPRNNVALFVVGVFGSTCIGHSSRTSAQASFDAAVAKHRVVVVV